MELKEAREKIEGVSEVYGLSKKQIALIKSAKDVEILKSCFRMLVNGLSETIISEIIKRSENADVCNSLANEKIAEKYSDFDVAMKQCDEASEQVEKLTNYNNDLIKVFETDVREAHKREVAVLEEHVNSLKESLSSKAEALKMWEDRYNELKKINVKLQFDFAALEAEKAKADRYSGDVADKEIKAPEPEPQLTSESMLAATIGKDEKSEGFSIFKGRQEDNKDKLMNIFVEKVLVNDEYSQEQKTFLMESIKEGISAKTFEWICNPKITLEFMEALKNYYERRRKK